MACHSGKLTEICQALAQTLVTDLSVFSVVIDRYRETLNTLKTRKRKKAEQASNSWINLSQVKKIPPENFVRGGFALSV